MATVTLIQPTDMAALPALTLAQASIDTETERSFVYVGNAHLDMWGAFFGIGLVFGTVTRVFVDTPDANSVPNLDITDLQFASTVAFMSDASNGQLQAVLAALLSGNDTLIGTPGNDGLIGFDGDDTFFGGSGNDTFYGAAGNDTFFGGGGADSFYGGAATSSDTASYANAPVGLFAGIDSPAFNSGDAAGDSYDSIENLIGSAFNDTLYGDANVNRLSGGGGNDVMVGKAGGDIFDGGAGSDTVGYDASFALRADLLLPGTNTGFAAGDVYISIENLAGSSFSDILLGDNAANVISGNLYPQFASGADQLFGRSGNDTLNGNDDNDALDGGPGNDLLNGGSGSDTLVGGTDNDTYALGAEATGVDTVTDTGGTADRIISTITRSLASYAAIEQLTLGGVSSIKGTGNNAANIITGNNAINTLDGGLGNDRLIGLGGSDILIGGAGKDTSTGGTGNDVFRFAAASHSVVGINADVITDFDKANDDRIDLSAVFGGTLAYRHNLAFSAAGQVRINDIAGADVLVEVNTGGSLAADMQIRLTTTALASMAATDFFL